MRRHCPRNRPTPKPTTLVFNEKQYSAHPKDVPSSPPRTSQLQHTANDRIISASFLGPQKTLRRGLGINSKICLKFLFCFLIVWSTMPSILCISFFFFFFQSMPICLHVYSCCLTNRAELSSHNREPTEPNIITICPLQKKLAISYL